MEVQLGFFSVILFFMFSLYLASFLVLAGDHVDDFQRAVDLLVFFVFFLL